MMYEEEDDDTIFDQQGLLDVKRKRSKWDFFWYQRFTKTVALSLAFFALGLCISIPGATLLDLKERTGTDVVKISIIFTARSLGYLVGSIFGGVLFDYYDQQILLFYTLVTTGIATIFVPWCTALTSLACMIASQGLAIGVLDTGGNMFCIRLWNKGSAPYMQVLHFSFAVGAFLAPLLARPFLLDNESFANHTFPQSHIPVNVHPSSLSSAMGPRSLHNHEVRWLETAASQHRALRDVRNSMESIYEQFPNIDDLYYDILKEDFAKGEQAEQASEGIRLNVALASGEVKDHILSHKDDFWLPEDNTKNGKNVEDDDNFWFSSTTARQAPRPAKPPPSEGDLNAEFASGDKFKDHLIGNKDFKPPEENTEDEANAFPITTTTTIQTPRPAKPVASEGGHLNAKFASGDKAKDHLIANQDFKPPEENTEDEAKSKTVTTANPDTSLSPNVTYFKNVTDSGNVTDDEERSNDAFLVNGNSVVSMNDSLAQNDVSKTVTLASGEKVKDHILSHKDDFWPPEDNTKNGENVKDDDNFWFTSTTARQAPRPAKPPLSEGGHLNLEFANGEKSKVHIISHKEDSRPQEDSRKNGKAKSQTVKYDDIFHFVFRAKREIDDDNASFVDTNVTQSENLTTHAFPITTTPTTQTPRPAKPLISDGGHLKADFASGDKAKDHFIANKDFKPPEDEAKSKTVTTANSDTSLSPNVTYFKNVTDGGNVTEDEERSNDTFLANGSSVVSMNDSLAQNDVSETVTLEAYITPTPKSAPSTTSAATTSTYTVTNSKTTSTVSASKPPNATSLIFVSTTVSTAGQTTDFTYQNVTAEILPPDNTTALAKATSTHPVKPQFNRDLISSTLEAVKNMSNIQFAYMIIGFVLIGNAAFFLLLYCRDCHARRLLHQVAALGPSPPPMSSCFRCSILCLLFIFFLFYVGMEVTFGGLVTTFAVESPLTRWTRQQGATLAALFWGSIAVGRGLAIFVARCFKPPCMLVVDLTLMLSGATMLSFAIQSSAAMLWVGTVTLGLGMSSVFPTAISWADLYYPLTGRATAVFITGSGVGEMVIPVVTGYLFENYDSMCLMYIVLGFSCLITVVFVMLQCIAWRNPLPASASKLGFVPLASEEENGIGMHDLDDAEIASSASTGYTENARRRQAVKKFVEDAEEETSKLMDSSD